MGNARVTPNAAGKMRIGKGKAGGLCSTAAEILAGRWENKGIPTASRVCIKERNIQGCSCAASELEQFCLT